MGFAPSGAKTPFDPPLATDRNRKAHVVFHGKGADGIAFDIFDGDGYNKLAMDKPDHSNIHKDMGVRGGVGPAERKPRMCSDEQG